MGTASAEAIGTMKNLYLSPISENVVVLPDHFAQVRNCSQKPKTNWCRLDRSLPL
jgi:hypothetical protein